MIMTAERRVETKNQLEIVHPPASVLTLSKQLTEYHSLSRDVRETESHISATLFEMIFHD